VLRTRHPGSLGPEPRFGSATAKFARPRFTPRQAKKARIGDSHPKAFLLRF
jgi:hypothetical protein